MNVKIFDSITQAYEKLEENKPRLLRVNNHEICLVRKGERLFAFNNSCPHMGERLHRGNTNYLDEIVCPLHAYRFSMRTGEESKQRCSALKIHVITIDSNGVFLEL